LGDAGFGALLQAFPAFGPDKKITWTSPDALRAAASKLRAEILLRSELGAAIAGLYRNDAGDEPAHEMLAEDLEGIAAIADYAKGEGLEHVALTIGW
jgi:hypothetical protein